MGEGYEVHTGTQLKGTVGEVHSCSIQKSDVEIDTDSIISKNNEIMGAYGAANPFIVKKTLDFKSQK